MALDLRNLMRRVKKAKEEGRYSGQSAGEGQQGNVQGPVQVVQGPVQPREAEDEEESEEKEEKPRIGLSPGAGGAAAWLDEGDMFSDVGDEFDEGEAPRDIDEQYPLIPQEPGPNEPVFARARITYDETGDSLIYRVIQPELSPRNEEVLERVENLLKERLNVNFEQMKKEEAKEYMRKQTRKILDEHNFGLTEQDKQIIQYYAYRNFVGLERLEPIMADKNIEDISCDGVNVPVYVYHRDPEIGSVKTNVVFESDEVIDSFVRKLAQRCGRSISMAQPLLDGSLPDGSRVQATLGTDIARRGTNFTIRRFTEDPLTPVHLLEYGSINEEMLAYLWMCVENGKSMLISGATASGKTTLLNALSLFIRPELKVVSIEDTPELRLPHPNWVPEVSREGFGFGEHDTGSVTMDDLLKESLRQRPDYIIVGEVRGEEAYILFQQIATGHPGMSTIHATNIQKVMDRLTTRPINLPPSLIENLDLIVFPKRTRRQGKYVRRVGKIYEFEGYDKDREEPIVNPVFEWKADEDEFTNTSDSSLLYAISEEHGITPREVQDEIERRVAVLEWMKAQGIKHYTDVGQVISTYYTHPDRILERVEAAEL